LKEEEIKLLLSTHSADTKTAVQDILKEFGEGLTKEIIEQVVAQVKTEQENMQLNDKALMSMQGGFDGFHKFVEAIAGSESADPDVKKEARALLNVSQKEFKALTAGDQGSYVIPPAYANEILKIGLGNANFASRCRKYPIKSNSLQIPYIVDKDHSTGNVFGGVRFYYVGEKTTVAKSDIKYGKLTMNLHKLMGLIDVTNEFIEDSPFGVASHLRDVFGEALGFQLDGDYTYGDGDNKPIGALHESNPALLDVVIPSGGVDPDTLTEMYSKVPGRFRSQAVWIYNPLLLPTLMGMTIGDHPVFVAGGVLANAPFDKILGKMAIESEHMEDEDGIALVNFSQYAILIKTGADARFESSMHIRFDTDEEEFKLVYRHDGQSLWECPMTLKNGTSQQSPFILGAKA